eukprot:5306026-Lingulodinium_polyedra.AAC.1
MGCDAQAGQSSARWHGGEGGSQFELWVQNQQRVRLWWRCAFGYGQYALLEQVGIIVCAGGWPDPMVTQLENVSGPS